MAQRLTLLTVVVFVLGLNIGQARSESSPVSRSVGPKMTATLEQLKDHLIGGELDTALAKAREVANAPNLTIYETYVIQTLIASVLVNLQRYGEAASALDTALATGQVPAKDIPNQLRSIAALHYNAGEYLKSIAVGERFFDAIGNQNDVQILVMIAQARFILKDYEATTARIQSAISVAVETGEAIDKRWVLLWIASEYQTGNAQGVAAALKEFAARFPDANYHLEWRLFPLLRDLPPVEL